ncbi:MAG: hypothetical protein J6A89_02495 [Clostridia bacterium]|nr:hypothetical protein [Clostridia bacterium]
MKGPLTQSICNRSGRVVLGTVMGGGMMMLLASIGFFTGEVVFLYIKAPVISILFWVPIIGAAFLGSERSAPALEIILDVVVGIVLCLVGGACMPIAPVNPQATYEDFLLAGGIFSATASIWGACFATPKKIRE